MVKLIYKLQHFIASLLPNVNLNVNIKLIYIQVVRCVAPDPVPFSTHTPQQALYDYNIAVTYTCDLAYVNTGGDLTRTCKEDFTWSGTKPICASKKFFCFLF